MNEPGNPSDLITSLMDLDEKQTLEVVSHRLAAGENSLRILEEAQEGMRLVGERYEERQYFVSGLMMAGEIFREIVELVEPVLQREIVGNETGTVLIGTVQGDIHDIGKNIFSTVLRCHGFNVIDLGLDIQADQFIEKLHEVNPDIIGLSGLLTTSYEAMREIVQKVRRLPDKKYSRLPIIIGGGTINAMVCAFIGADYWAVDAMMGTQLCIQIMAENQDRAS